MIRTLLLTIFSILLPFQVCGETSDDKSSSWNLEYFDSDKPERILVWEFARDICNVNFGKIYKSTKIDCDLEGCKGKLEFNKKIYEGDVLIDSNFRMLFSKSQKFDTSEKKKETINGEKGSFDVTYEYLFENSGLNSEDVKASAECVNRIGALLAEKVIGSEQKGLLSNLHKRELKDNNVEVVSLVLKELEYASIEVVYPKEIKYGDIKPIEVTLIPSLRLGAAIESINIEQQNIKKLKSNMENFDPPAIPRLLKKLGIVGSATSETSEWAEVGLQKKDNHFKTLTVDIKGAGADIEAITPTKQSLTPLVLSRWIWQVSSTKDDNQSFYLTMDGINTKSGSDFHYIFPIKIDFKKTLIQRFWLFLVKNWQWFAGTILIPLMVFSWKRKYGSE